MYVFNDKFIIIYLYIHYYHYFYYNFFYWLQSLEDFSEGINIFVILKDKRKHYVGRHFAMS